MLIGFLIVTVTTVDSFAQNRPRQFVADSGVISLEQNQKLRLTIATASDNQAFDIRFRRCTYAQQDGIFVVNSTQISPLLRLASNEARFLDVFPTAGSMAVRARVGSRNPNIVVTFQLVDTSTGEIAWADEAIVAEQDVWATDF